MKTPSTKFDLEGFSETRILDADLVSGGWLSPDTYGNEFSAPSAQPGLYMLMMVEMASFRWSRIAYVGMSKNVSARWKGHHVIRAIGAMPGFYVKRWFKHMAADGLRAAELDLIRHHSPPWNIAGRGAR